MAELDATGGAAPPVSTPVSAAPVVAPSPALSPSPAPVPPTVAATPAPDSSAAPAPATSSPSPAGEGASVEVTPTAPADAPIQPAKSFLTEAVEKNKPPEAPKTEEKAPSEEPKAASEAPDAAATPQPIAWEYSVPEEISINPEGTLKAKVQFDEKAKAQVDKMLEAFSSNPRDKANQQALVDFHIERLKEQQQQQADYNRNFWAETRKGWREDWAKDAEIGGSGMLTARAAAARVLDIAMRHSDTSEANKKFHRDVEAMFETTGAGDHPALGRIFVRLARFLDESPPSPPNISPPRDIGSTPGKRRLSDAYKDMPR